MLIKSAYLFNKKITSSSSSGTECPPLRRRMVSRSKGQETWMLNAPFCSCSTTRCHLLSQSSIHFFPMIFLVFHQHSLCPDAFLWSAPSVQTGSTVGSPSGCTHTDTSQHHASSLALHQEQQAAGQSWEGVHQLQPLFQTGNGKWLEMARGALIFWHWNFILHVFNFTAKSFAFRQLWFLWGVVFVALSKTSNRKKKFPLCCLTCSVL